MKANVSFASTAIVAAALISTTAQPAYTQRQNLPAAATLVEVQHLQELKKIFPQPPSEALTASVFLPQYEIDPDDHGEIATYQPTGPPLP